MKNLYPEYRKERIDTEQLYSKLSPTEKKLLEDFLKYCSIKAGATKIKDIRTNILQFRDVVEVPLNKINLKVLRDFLAVLEKTNRTEWTKNGSKNALKRFLRWHYKDWSERFDAFKDIKTPHAFNDRKINEGTLITPEELKALCHAANNYRDKAIIMLTYETGARPQEIRHLKWKDISFNADGTAKISLFSGKTTTARTILIKDALISLDDWKQHYSFPDRTEHDYIFPSIKTRMPMSETNFTLLFTRLGKKAKLNRQLFPYLLRHTRLNELYKVLPEQVHKKFAGHSKGSQMTSVYSHISSDAVIVCLRDSN